MSYSNPLKTSHITLLVAALLVPLIGGCGKKKPAEDPASLQSETVEVPPPERLPTESGPAEAGDDGENVGQPPSDAP